MVVLNKIYTRTGDKGDTALGSGERVPKDDARINAYGTVDETNACIGIARQALDGDGHSDLDAVLARIQNDMFDLGADLCTPDRGEPLDYEPLRVTQAQVERLEQEIDRLNKELAPLRSFVLPGGSPASAALHLARTVSRRAERAVVTLSGIEGELVSEPALRYLNRLSDLLFVAARYVNDKGEADVLWAPGENR